MLTIRQITQHLLAFFLMTFVFLGCNTVFAETASNVDEKHAQKTLNMSGLYLGFYPCSDCTGIRTTLALNKNSTYVYISIYVGKSDREIIEKGKFTMGGENGNTLVLTPKKGSTTTQQYLIEDDMLIKMDEDGNRITKDGADGYILKRKDVVNTSGSGHGGH